MKNFLSLFCVLFLVACSSEKQPPIVGIWKSVKKVKCSEDFSEKQIKSSQLSENEIEFTAKAVRMTVTQKGCKKQTEMHPEYFVKNDVVVWKNARVVFDTCDKKPSSVDKGEQRFKYELKNDKLMKFTAQYGNAGCGYLVRI